MVEASDEDIKTFLDSSKKHCTLLHNYEGFFVQSPPTLNAPACPGSDDNKSFRRQQVLAQPLFAKRPVYTYLEMVQR